MFFVNCRRFRLNLIGVKKLVQGSSSKGGLPHFFANFAHRFVNSQSQTGAKSLDVGYYVQHIFLCDVIGA